MSLINFILNLAGLLLWFNLRAAQPEPHSQITTTIPAGTPRSTGAIPKLRWVSLVALLGLVCARALFYRLLGPAVDWT